MGKVVVTRVRDGGRRHRGPGRIRELRARGLGLQVRRGPEGDKFKLDEVMAADGLLLGRVTYEGFAAAWPSREGEFADKFNNMAKYVVSSTLEDPEWNNSTVIKRRHRGRDLQAEGAGRTGTSSSTAAPSSSQRWSSTTSSTSIG